MGILIIMCWIPILPSNKTHILDMHHPPSWLQRNNAGGDDGMPHKMEPYSSRE